MKEMKRSIENQVSISLTRSARDTNIPIERQKPDAIRIYTKRLQ